MLSFFRQKNVSQAISLILLAAFLDLTQGCSYYKVHKSVGPVAPTISSLQNDKKLIILHKGQDAWEFKNIVAREDSVKGMIITLVDHDKYKTTDTAKVNRFKKEDKINKTEILNEVHIYVTNLSRLGSNYVSIPVKAVQRIEIYDPAKGATIASWVFGTLGVIALGAAIVTIIVALTKQSCPFIYVNDDSSSRLIGEIYSGAIYPSLERTDYLPLPAPKPGQKDYTIRMTNEVHEIQNTNLIELNVFDHPKGTNVLLDKYGKYQTTCNLQQPIRATNLSGKNILDLIRDKDTLTYFNVDPGKNPDLKDGIIMTFKRPQDASVAKLVVNARSTFWLDYVFTRFHELFGKEYNCWVDKQQTVPPIKMKSWMLDQNIPLSLYIEKNGKWQFIDYYNIVGPIALKQDILAFDISNIKTDSLKIKLEYGNLFWEVDYAGIDYSLNIPVTQKIAQFVSAVDNKDRDVRNLLVSADMLYYVQPEIGDAVDMKFNLPEQLDVERTLILHSQGYYKIILNLTGEERKKDLLAFRKKGHFAKFSNGIFQRQMGLNAN